MQPLSRDRLIEQNRNSDTCVNENIRDEEIKLPENQKSGITQALL